MKLSLKCFALTPSSRLDKFLLENEVTSQKQGTRLKFKIPHSDEVLTQLFNLRAGYSELDIELRISLKKEEKALINHYELRPEKIFSLTSKQRDLAAEFYFDRQRETIETLPLDLGTLQESQEKFIKQVIDTSGESATDKKTFTDYFSNWCDETNSILGRNRNGEEIFRLRPKQLLPNAISDGAIYSANEYLLQGGYLCYTPQQIGEIHFAKISDSIPFLCKNSYTIISSEIAAKLEAQNYGFKLVPVFTSNSSVYQNYHSTFTQIMAKRIESGKGDRIRLLNPE